MQPEQFIPVKKISAIGQQDKFFCPKGQIFEKRGSIVEPLLGRDKTLLSNQGRSAFLHPHNVRATNSALRRRAALFQVSSRPKPFANLRVAICKGKTSGIIMVSGRPVDHAEVGSSWPKCCKPCIVYAVMIFINEHVRARRSRLIEVTHLTVRPPSLAPRMTMITIQPRAVHRLLGL